MTSSYNSIGSDTIFWPLGIPAHCTHTHTGTQVHMIKKKKEKEKKKSNFLKETTSRFTDLVVSTLGGSYKGSLHIGTVHCYSGPFQTTQLHSLPISQKLHFLI